MFYNREKFYPCKQTNRHNGECFNEIFEFNKNRIEVKRNFGDDDIDLGTFETPFMTTLLQELRMEIRDQHDMIYIKVGW